MLLDCLVTVRVLLLPSAMVISQTEASLTLPVPSRQLLAHLFNQPPDSFNHNPGRICFLKILV